MKKIILFILVAFFANSANAQNEFITRWDFSQPGSGPNIIKFGFEAVGPINYQWYCSGGWGSGTFNNSPAVIQTPVWQAGVVTLIIDSTNLRRFKMIEGPIQYNGAGLIDVQQWGTTQWSSMEDAFWGCYNLNISATDVPNLSMVTNMSNMFYSCLSLNSPSNINSWNTSNITLMYGVFQNASSFNQPIGNWNTSNVTNMGDMFGFNYYMIGFNDRTKFNQPIGNWNTSNVTYMGGMFAGDTSFNQPIGNWNTGNVLNMRYMFYQAKNFNKPIGNWNTSNVMDMSNMFQNAYAFNQPIGNWNTGNCTSMGNMFWNATSFNQPIGSWNTSNDTDMTYMFNNAINFNQPLNSWNTNNVKFMNSMFSFATNFNQNIGNLTLHPTVDLSYMLNNSGMDCSNYSSTLNGWANNANTPNGRNLGSLGLHYSANVQADRNYLINTKGWTITGDTMSNNSCSFPTGVSTFNENHLITISPNPTNSIFKIECPMNGASVILYNSFGQKLLTSKIENQTSLINISHFSKGIYIAEIIDDKTSYRVKIVKD